MLDELFGSSTTVKCLLYLAAEREGYPLAIARSFAISNTQVIRTLTKLEHADILLGRTIGRAKVYSLNERWLLSKELKSMLDKVLHEIALGGKKKFFSKRKRAPVKSRAR